MQQTNTSINQPQLTPMVQLRTGDVNLETRTLEGVVIMEVGEATGHGFFIEESFMDDFKAYIDEEKDGRLRSNFGHNWDNMGLQLGSYTNFRKEGAEKLRADLTVLKAADNSPVLPGIGTYILEMAQEAPDQIMNSIVFEPKYYYQYDSNGEEVILQDYDYYTGTFANQIPGEKVFAKFGKAYSSDMVDDGAVTSTLFHRPKLNKMSDSTTKKTFLQKIQDQISKLTAKIDALGASTEEAEEVEETEEDTTDLNTDQHEEQSQEENQDNEELKALSAQIETLTQRIEEIEENTPAALHAGGRSEGGDSNLNDDEPAWLNDPINQKAMSRFSNKDKK